MDFSGFRRHDSIAFPQLTEYENDIILMFEEIFPDWSDIIRQQIQYSDISREDMYSSYFVDFHVPRHMAPIPCSAEVPVAIIAGEVRIPSSQVLRRVNGHVVTNASNFWVPDEYAMGIHFHFQSGYLYELEVYSLSGNNVSLENIRSKEITYVLESGIRTLHDSLE